MKLKMKACKFFQPEEGWFRISMEKVGRSWYRELESTENEGRQRRNSPPGEERSETSHYGQRKFDLCLQSIYDLRTCLTDMDFQWLASMLDPYSANQVLRGLSSWNLNQRTLHYQNDVFFPLGHLTHPLTPSLIWRDAIFVAAKYVHSHKFYIVHRLMLSKKSQQ